MNKNIFVKSFEVNSFLVNSQGFLGLYQTLNLLQDSAWAHANILGIGNEDFNQKNMFWALTRQKLVMKRWPRWGEHVEVHTWVRPGNHVFSIREFEIYVSNEKVGESSTSWVALDISTRKIAIFEGKSIFEKFKVDRKLDFEADKILPFKDGEKISSFKVRNSDIDVNQHVNNTKYAQWILDSLKFSDHKNYILNSYEVNFLSESKIDDKVQLEGLEENPQKKFFFQGKRDRDDKVLFTAKLEVSLKN